MRFLAILKDSLREAIDAKVFYVLMGLSCLLILLLASIRFEPESADRGMMAIVKRLPGATSPNPFKPQPPVHYQLETFEQVNEPAPPWEGSYKFVLNADDDERCARAFRFFVVLLGPHEDVLKQLTQEQRRNLVLVKEQLQGLPLDELKKIIDIVSGQLNQVTPAQMEQFLKDQLAAHGALEVTKVQAEANQPNSTRFVVEARARDNAYLTWPHGVSLFFGALPLNFIHGRIGYLVFMIERGIVGETGAGITLLISTIITSFFIPNMLRKGTVDLLLAKPLHRTTLLLYKYLGGLSFMFLNTAVIVVGVWLVLGLSSGLWTHRFLLVIFILTFEFALFYAVSTLFGVVTQSPIVAILATFIAWAILFTAGIAYYFFEPFREHKVYPDWVYWLTDSAHTVLPRYKDLDELTGQLLATDLLPPDSPDRVYMTKVIASTNWTESLGVTAAAIVLLLGLACWRFSRKDY